MSRRGPVERRPRIGHVFLDALEYLWAERFCIECTARTIPSVANRAMIFVSTGLVGRTQVAPTGDYQTGMMANRQQDSPSEERLERQYSLSARRREQTVQTFVSGSSRAPERSFWSWIPLDILQFNLNALNVFELELSQKPEPFMVDRGIQLTKVKRNYNT